METFTTYDPEGFYDELVDENGKPRPGVELLVDKIESLPDGDLDRRQKEAEALLLKMGITFNVYGQDQGTEKIFPFDLIPRIISDDDWQPIEAGLKQRIFALNEFLQDIYNDQKILKDKVVPKDLILSSKTYRKECVGFTPPKKIWCHVTGTDLIRGADGCFYVLEDNLRCPSGVSYVLENRQVLKRTFPYVFEKSKVRAVDEYPGKLLDMLEYLAPDGVDSPTIGVLTPGIYNSAYFEHSFLSQQMGVELVEGRDLVVSDGYVHMLTTKGLKRVDVLYRRIDDDFIDPSVFRPDSLLGVKGLIDVYRDGKIAMANAPGTGIADDKAVYAYVPKIIKYYTGEEPILPNVPTYICQEKADRDYVLDHLSELVVKAANESGGYGMLIGPHSTKKEQQTFAKLILAEPRNYIAQPTISLSRVPTIIGDRLEGRHVDLRPYIIFGEDIYVQPGGLTRVALKKGSLVVNSSQGGGSKDTWVLAPGEKEEN
ncbi:circularly permuted type 2 ATP-grasp protein [Desulforhopalus sp. IMCC35007]|uniref:circularly permuted type 2 ATP-grasp protein n=1 Tax=Desulforhopalus sp. IMCC35007 TaxID=2569543 RepID=UPI0010AE3FAE|nr:circularly permuted type 2 ATP-grasp protein [Desulforhopalus sp. IMCC35007]TKB08621.1 circularly permuted type 2 ATP-grasp protein [Desulforhopalus sp. IMCC35007]